MNATRSGNHEHLRKLAKEATPGPWKNEPNTHAGRVWVSKPALGSGILRKRAEEYHKLFCVRTDDCEPYFQHRTKAEYVQREHDAAFIAACDPTTVLDFLNENERLRKELAEALPTPVAAEDW